MKFASERQYQKLRMKKTGKGEENKNVCDFLGRLVLDSPISFSAWPISKDQNKIHSLESKRGLPKFLVESHYWTRAKIIGFLHSSTSYLIKLLSSRDCLFSGWVLEVLSTIKKKKKEKNPTKLKKKEIFFSVSLFIRFKKYTE